MDVGFLERIFGQDAVRKYSVKVVITYLWLVMMTAFMVFGFFLRIPIPETFSKFFVNMSYIVIGSYFLQSGILGKIVDQFKGGNSG